MKQITNVDDLKDDSFIYAISKPKISDEQRIYLVYLKKKFLDGKKEVMLDTKAYGLNLDFSDDGGKIPFNDVFKRFKMFNLSKEEIIKYKTILIERNI